MMVTGNVLWDRILYNISPFFYYKYLFKNFDIECVQIELKFCDRFDF